MSDTRAGELAPSEERADELGGTQIVGLAGAGLAVLGAIVIVFSQSQPRLMGLTWAYLFSAVGVAAMFYHALRDPSLEIRRAYVFLGLALLALALLTALVPGPAFAQGQQDKHAGYYFLPWSPLFGLLSLAFLVTPLRHETDAKFKGYGLLVLLTVGAGLTLGSVVFGILYPTTLVGPGILLGLLGLGFVTAFLSQVDCSDGPGHLVASLLGVLGGVALLYAVGRSAFPTLLYEGPPALKNAFQAFDVWKVLARAALVLLCVGFAAWGGLSKGVPAWLRGGLAVIGLGFAGVLVFSGVGTVAVPAPRPFLVPGGLLLAALGSVFLGTSLGIVSDSPFVTMTRRELAVYFYSPIAYFVLLGMTVVMFIGYWLFLGVLAGAKQEGFPLIEPILQYYVAGSYIGPIVAFILIPLLTMRTFSEEKRSNTLEVLLTAPVGEVGIVLSKFVACWLFYLLTWVPMGLYLIALRAEGGEAFDYRPLLSLYAAIAVSGAGFVAMGLFFSSLTRNQIIAAVLTFGGMLFLYTLQYGEYFERNASPAQKQILSAVAVAAYPRTWGTALHGQLAVRDLVLYVTMAVFWLYLTVKTLEARKWS